MAEMEQQGLSAGLEVHELTGEAVKRFFDAQAQDDIDVTEVRELADSIIVAYDDEVGFVILFKNDCYAHRRMRTHTNKIKEWAGLNGA